MTISPPEQNHPKTTTTLKCGPFNCFKEEQQAIQSYAKKKKTTYTIVSLAYAGALGTAILEKTGTFGMKPCTAKTAQEQADKAKKKWDDAEEKLKRAQESNNKVAAYTQNVADQKKAYLNAQKTSRQDVREGQYTPYRQLYQGRHLLWGRHGPRLQAATGGSGRGEKSEKNISSTSTKLSPSFESTMARYCPKGREDLKDPSCYCYTSKGRPNPQRTKSNICQNLWKKDNVNYAVAASAYREKEGEPEGCLAKNGQFDPDCECRKYKDTATGKNLCADTSTNIVIPASLQRNLSGVGQAVKAANVLTGASSDTNALNSDALAKAATKTRRYAENLLKQYNKQATSRNMVPLPLTPAFVEKAVTSLANARLKKRFGTGRAAAPLTAQTATAPALKSAIKKVQNKKGSAANKSAWQRPSKKTPAKKKTAPFQWATQTPSGAERKTLHIQDEGPKKETPKNIDLHTNPQVSIWKIISKRYLISGLPILFPETP